jgi:hypothetical protein
LEKWVNPEPSPAASSALGSIEKDVGGLFEWERAGRHRDRDDRRDGYGDDHGDPTIGEQNGVKRFYGRGADVPGPRRVFPEEDIPEDAQTATRQTPALPRGARMSAKQTEMVL